LLSQVLDPAAVDTQIIQTAPGCRTNANPFGLQVEFQFQVIDKPKPVTANVITAAHNFMRYRLERLV
jgi:hypothetical protein